MPLPNPARAAAGPPPLPSRRRGGRLSLVLSAMCYPGLGQLVQKRWLHGLFYAASFSVASLVFLVAAGRIILNYYRLLDFEAMVDDHLPVASMLIGLALALGLWLANLADVALANARAR